MADISLKFKADALGKSLEKLAPRVEAELNQAVKNLANAAYTSMVAQIQNMKMNESNRSEYLKGLDFKDLGNDSYLISLDSEWANKLESGFAGYSIRDAMLASQKIVQVGSRSGQPFVRKAKDGHKFAAVPMNHQPFAGKGGPDFQSQFSSLSAKNAKGMDQAITKVFKDIDGNAISGKVASVGSVPQGTDPNLAGLTKYQSVSAKGKVSSVYLTFRMVSENGKDWVHPGHKGYGLFKKAQDYIEEQMDVILKTVLK